MKAGESRVALAEALATLAENQQKQGVGTKLDTLRSKVQLQTERQRLIQAQTQRLTALAGLVRLLDLQPGTSIELMDTLAAPALPVGGVQETYQAGLTQRPELAALDAREKAAENLREAAQGLRLPTLVATGSYGSSALQSQPSATTYQISLGLRVPLFTQHRGHVVQQRSSDQCEFVVVPAAHPGHGEDFYRVGLGRPTAERHDNGDIQLWPAGPHGAVSCEGPA